MYLQTYKNRLEVSCLSVNHCSPTVRQKLKTYINYRQLKNQYSNSGRMVIDILKFFLVYCLVLFAFACGLNQLMWYYASMRQQVRNLFYIFFISWPEHRHSALEKGVNSVLDKVFNSFLARGNMSERQGGLNLWLVDSTTCYKEIASLKDGMEPRNLYPQLGVLVLVRYQ